MSQNWQQSLSTLKINS